MNSFKVRAKTALMFLAFSMFCESVQSDELPKVTARIAGKNIRVEIAQTEQQRSKGLMFRKKLDPNSGMLFVFEVEKPLSFWMKNTLIPLSIGFFNSEKILVHKTEMVPASAIDLNIPTYSSQVPARYALEMPAGWFEKNKIKLGSKLSFDP